MYNLICLSSGLKLKTDFEATKVVNGTSLFSGTCWIGSSSVLDTLAFACIALIMPSSNRWDLVAELLFWRTRGRGVISSRSYTKVIRISSYQSNYKSNDKRSK